MRKSWAMVVSLALAGCGAEFAAVEETIVDGGEDAVELEGGAFTSASGTSGGGAIRVTTSGTIVSAHPRVVRVPEPTKITATQLAEVLEAPAAKTQGGIEVAASWMREAPRVDELVASGDFVAWGTGRTFTVASRRDGAILKSKELGNCFVPIAHSSTSLFALCGGRGNEVVAYDPSTLEERWRRSLNDQVVTIAEGSGTVLVTLRSAQAGRWQEVVALGDRGEERWHTWLPSSNVDVRADGDQLLAFERDPTVWAFDRDSGRVRWSRKTDQAILGVIPIRESLTAVIGQQGVWMLDDGREVASLAADSERRSVIEVHWPLLYSCDDGHLAAVDLETGREKWHAQVSVPQAECTVFPSDAGTFVLGDDHVMSLDTTQPAGRARAITIQGRFKDVTSEHHVRGREVLVGKAHVLTGAGGRFVATVRQHGPILVSLEDVHGPQSRTTIWPDAGSHQKVELTNDYYEDCH